MLEVEKYHPAELPRGDQLPDTDGIPLDNETHREQASKYLIDPARRWFHQQEIVAFVGGNSPVYYVPPKPKRKAGIIRPRRLGPDVYVVMGRPFRRQGKWVVWEEGGLYPNLAIELLSPSTEVKDRGSKFVIYRDQWKVKDYFLFETETGQLEGFCLKRRAFVSVKADQQGLYPCSSVPLKLGVRNGWLRWFTLDGQLVLTDEELASEERTRADEERARAERLAAKLRELGIEE